MPDDDSDADLVGQVLDGRGDRYGDLARRWAGRVAALCHAHVGTQAADDLVQESLMRGFSALRTLQERGRFGAWLCGIARRVCLDWLKSKRRTERVFSSVADFDADLMPAKAEALDCDADLASAGLLSEVDALPLEFRETLLLYYYNDLTYAELGELLDVSAATINARLTKARAMLRDRLVGAAPVPEVVPGTTIRHADTRAQMDTRL